MVLKVKKCNSNLQSLKLHGEGGEVTPEKAEELMSAFRIQLQRKMEEKKVTIDRVYNADQTGLYYRHECAAERNKSEEEKKNMDEFSDLFS